MLAMTLMVLQFDLPDVSAEMSSRQIKEFLIAQLPALYIYLVQLSKNNPPVTYDL